MKRFFLSLIMIGLLSLFAGADNFKAPERKQSVVFTDTTTNHTYEIKEIKYPIFKSKSGAFYIWKTSKKTGNQYKYYLPKEIQKQMGRQYKE